MYEVYVTVPDTWQIRSRLEVRVRLTVTQIGTEVRQVKYVTEASYPKMFLVLDVYDAHLQAYWVEEAEWASMEWESLMNFTEVGDYWEKEISLGMNSWLAGKLERGEVAKATLRLKLCLDEYGANHTLISQPYLRIPGDAAGGPMEVAIFRPFLSTRETLEVGGVSAVFVFGLLLLALKRFGLVSFSFMDALSRFSDAHPISSEIGSLAVLFATWFLSIVALRLSVTVSALFFIIMVPLEFLVLVVNIGIFQFLYDRWGPLQTAFGFAVTMFSLYVTNLVLEALEFAG